MSYMENTTNKSLFLFEGTLAEELLAPRKYPWEALPWIEEYIFYLSSMLEPSEYTLTKGADHKKNIWISKKATIAKSATIYGPAIIGHYTQVRPNALICGNVLIGQNCIIGNGVEIKNSVLLNYVELERFNYVGDSILGNRTRLCSGAVLSNLKSDKTEVFIGPNFGTGFRRVGSFLGDKVQVGCNSVVNPGTVVGKKTEIYPLSFAAGIIPNDSIVRGGLTIIKKSKDDVSK